VIIRARDARRMTLSRRARAGEVRRLLPGVYAPDDSLEWRVAAVPAWRPDAVICGRAAARLTYLPTLAVETVEVATRTAVAAPGYRFSRTAIPLEHVLQRGPLRLTAAAWTALELATTMGGDAIDDVLRARAVRLGDLWEALRSGSGRPGNRDRLRLLMDSRDNAWSAAERLAHRVLRQHRITGWRANHPVLVGGRRYYLDIAFPALRLALEIDGYAYHGPDRFESDRSRQNDLVLAGWTVLRITWRMLNDEPEAVVAAVRQALLRTRRQQRRTPA
jgi:very-short-patch-repair endonuclease